MPYSDISTDSAFERRLPRLRQDITADLRQREVTIPRNYRFESVAGGDRTEDVKLVTYSHPGDPESFMTLSCEGSEDTGYIITDLTTAHGGGRPQRNHMNMPASHPTDYIGLERRV